MTRLRIAVIGGGAVGASVALFLKRQGGAAVQVQVVEPDPGLALAILIDQGLADKFLEAQLHPHLFEHACAAVKQPLTLRRHAGYDHGYYFISTFINDHLDHHARILLRG